MAEEPQKAASAEEVVVVAEPVSADKPETSEAEADKVPITETEAEEKVAVTETDAEEKAVTSTEEAEKAPQSGVQDKISQSVSFKEETNVVSDLPDSQKKALDELKKLVQDALNKRELTAPKVLPPPDKKEQPDASAAAAAAAPAPEPEKKDADVVTEEEPKQVEVAGAGEGEEAEKKEVQVTETEETKEVQVTETEVQVTETEEKKEVQETVAEEKKEVEETVTEVKKEVEEAVTEEKKEVEETVTEEKKEVEETVTEEKKEAEETVTEEKAGEVEVGPEEVEIWGIPLLADERSDVILLKFLRARDFKVKDAFNMIKNTVRWRKEFGIDSLVEEDLGNDWDKVVFSDGYDKEGHSVCYNVFGEFEDKELYNKTFSDEEKRNKFIRWRIQFLEKSVRNLDFSPKGISTIVQVNDLKNSPGLGKRELRQATNQALQLLQDNYPEFLAKQIFINVPWWYLAFSRFISPFLTQRTKSKFVFAGPSKSADTLFKYIAPELVPVQYGGLSRDGEQEFTTSDPVTEVTIKPATKHVVEFPVTEKSNLVWEIRVVGWDVTYGSEFVPSAEDGYTVIIQKSRKISPTDETIITSGFKTGEAGKVLLNIDNQTSKKKKLLYRFKAKSIAE